MKRVNSCFLRTLLEPLTGLADDDDAVREYRWVDPNNEPEIRGIIRRMIVPHLETLIAPEVEEVKLAYRYYLTKSELVDFRRWFEKLFDSCLPPFDAPNDARLIFLWIWEEVFPGEDFHLPDWETYEEKPDLNATWKIRL